MGKLTLFPSLTGFRFTDSSINIQQRAKDARQINSDHFGGRMHDGRWTAEQFIAETGHTDRMSLILVSSSGSET